MRRRLLAASALAHGGVQCWCTSRTASPSTSQPTTPEAQRWRSRSPSPRSPGPGRGGDRGEPRHWKTTLDHRSDVQREQLDRIHRYGNNGWTTGCGRDQGSQGLDRHEEAGGSLTPTWCSASAWPGATTAKPSKGSPRPSRGCSDRPARLRRALPLEIVCYDSQELPATRSSWTGTSLPSVSPEAMRSCAERRSPRHSNDRAGDRLGWSRRRTQGLTASPAGTAQR